MRLRSGTTHAVVVAAMMLVSATSSIANAILSPPEMTCRQALAGQAKRYLKKTHRVRRKCLQQMYKGRLSPATDCAGGFEAPALEPIQQFRSDLSVALARNCVGIDLQDLGFPGRCQTSGAFDVNALETCALNTLDGVIKDMLEAESPPAAPLDGPALRCAIGVARSGGIMVAEEVAARTDCLLDDDAGPGAVESTCRAQLAPYGPGTGDSRRDAKIYDGYVALLAGIPASCKYTRLDRIGFQEGCDDTTGGRFSSFDLKLCLFDGHRKDALQSLEAAFPSPPVCGNGVLEGDEECDDGNDVNTDGCLNDCRAARCGDGVVEAGVEQCDDGNNKENDPCLNDCKSARCGDGKLCTSLSPLCTTGPDGGPEVCDDGNAVAGDGCSSTCTPEFCGDGIRQAGLGEECDDGASNSDAAPDACRTDCKNPRCGDGVVDSGETCDPPGAGCSSSCTPLLCGNGQLDAGEECDNGAANSNATPDACRTTCKRPRCGDGVTDPSNQETCDDGNTSDTDACLNDCKAARCGDGFVRAGVEECDDGNTSQTDACLNNCKAARCGDGVVRAGVEQCDDGNAVNTDPCLNTCKNARCGDGAVCSAATCKTGPTGGVEQCDAGTSNSDTTSDACRTTCAAPYCGDGVVDSGEDCDEGAANGTAGSTCSASCKAPRQCSVVARMTSSEKLGALKVEIDYTSVPGGFAGSGLTVECTSSLTGVSYSFFDDDTARTLRESIIALSGFTGPADLATCKFLTAGADPAPQNFTITVLDASTVQLEPASPTVAIASVSCGAAASIVATSAAACPEHADETCTSAKHASLVARRDPETTRASLRWSWRGRLLPDDAFGDPSSEVDYAMCLYEGTGPDTQRAAEWFFPSDPAWERPKKGGWLLQSSASAGDVRTGVRLRPEAGMSSLLRMNAIGSDVAERLLADSPVWDEQPLSMTVQMRNSDGMCWSSELRRIVRADGDGLKLRKR